MCRRLFPAWNGCGPTGQKHFVATTQSCRFPLIHLPMISSVRPARSSPPPSGYTSEVSMKVIPPAAARSRIANEVASSHWYPNVIVPRHSFETFKPADPNRTCSTAPPRSPDSIVQNDRTIVLAAQGEVKLRDPALGRRELQPLCLRV